ncbi:MAG: DJ-1/PfpI family protein, partial [Clostridiales bacterium]|nr:DJ-1/PfpI family protein [Clostridiales bacterium]
MSSTVLFLADGFEEIEALSVIDILRRGNADVVTMSINDKAEVIGKSNIKVIADKTFDKDFALKAEMIILPGGGVGTENLKNSEDIIDVIKYFSDNNKMISAICAAPSILGINGVLKGYKATCYPGFEKVPPPHIL